MEPSTYSSKTYTLFDVIYYVCCAAYLGFILGEIFEDREHAKRDERLKRYELEERIETLEAKRKGEGDGNSN